MARARRFAAGRFALELAGTQAGFLMSVSGGDAEGDVGREPIGADLVVRKHLANVRYTDLELAAGAGMQKAFYDWIAGTLDHKYVRKDGAVSFVDANGKEVARLSFFNALVREIAFPALDAGAKDPARLTVKAALEYARRGKGSTANVPAGKPQKAWLPSNFRLKIDGVDCSRVNKIESIVVRQEVVEAAIGEKRDYLKEPAPLEIGDLVVSVAESHAADFLAWHDDFVVKGNNDASAEKSGTLELLAPDLKTVLFTLAFKGLGIFKLTHEAATGDAIPRLRASMYVEELAFTPA